MHLSTSPLKKCISLIGNLWTVPSGLAGQPLRAANAGVAQVVTLDDITITEQPLEWWLLYAICVLFADLIPALTLLVLLQHYSLRGTLQINSTDIELESYLPMEAALSSRAS